MSSKMHPVRLNKSIEDNDASNKHSNAACTAEPDKLADNKMLPRVGDEYQAEIPPTHLKNEEFNYADIKKDEGGSLDLLRDVEINENLDEPWSGVERDSFLLGLYMFGKNFYLLQRMVESKTMACIQFFYYRKFYSSDEHHRWSELRKLKSGERLLNRWRRKELLSSLCSCVSEECQKNLVEVSRRFEDGNISFEEYIFGLKGAVGISLLIETIGIGKEKQMEMKQGAEKLQPQANGRSESLKCLTEPRSEKNTNTEPTQIASNCSGDDKKSSEESPLNAMVLYNQSEPFNFFDREEQLISSSKSTESSNNNDHERSPEKVIEPKRSKPKSELKRKRIQRKSKTKTKKMKIDVEKAVVKAKASISDKQEETKVTRIRASPKVLSDMVSRLSEAQKKWVKQAGFGCLLDFSLKELPHKFGYNVVEAFDHASVTLRLNSGNINITEYDVAEVLGLPLGHRAIEFGSKSSGMLEEWRAQFPTSAPWKITASTVCKKIKESPDVTLMFKMNFLVIMMNTLVESLGNPYVCQQIINFQGDVDESAQYNWCALVIDSLVDSKPVWQENPDRKYYSGPLAFLLLLYVDRVMYKGRRLVKRMSPTFIGWTDSLLRKRQGDELKSNSFGKGAISKSLREETLVSRQEVGSSDTTMSIDTIKKDCISRLEMSANNLVSAVTKFDAQLMLANTLCPNNPRVKEIESMITRLLGTTNANHQKTTNKFR